VSFVKFGDYSMDLRIIYHADPARAGDIAHEVNVGILAAFGKAGLQMAFPTRTLHVQPTAVAVAAALTENA
jgi:small-conductance mechanosensitive channel